MTPTPSFKEDHISQLPALQLLQNLGYKYLTPEEATRQRGGRLSNVLLEGVMEDWLREHNRIQFKGGDYAFTDGNIHAAVEALKAVLYDGLVRTNEKIYDLLCLGKSLQQSISGDLKSFQLHYVDWEHPENNVYHVTEEFAVERTASHETCRPDIILFVNGIPFCVIECKRPDLGPGKDPIEQAISQQIRNQKDEYIPRLFIYSQLLIAVSKNEAKYGTTATPLKFWAAWREDGIDEIVQRLINTPLPSEKKDKLFATRFRYVRDYLDGIEQAGGREPTGQDCALYALCRPERLLELAFRYVLYDAGDKKIARYQQYFTVQNIMERITTLDEEGRRHGGVVWHTQGSGKSLTMVMLAKAIALELSIPSPKIVLVTDRVDLDDQIYGTFLHCGKEPTQATTGQNLVDLLQDEEEHIITTVIDKFETAMNKRGLRFDSPNIFVLVDEGHRGQYGPLAAKMRAVLRNACFIGFTGTPLLKRDKNTIVHFGGLIQPVYTIKRAVDDKAVVPLLYEGREVEQYVDAEPIDQWMHRVCEDLTEYQVADLKKKYAREEPLNKAERRVQAIAWDISNHFRKNWKGTPFKAQLVAPRKTTALLYKRFLDEFDLVTSEVLISPPDDREGEEDVYEENKDEVVRFWRGMMEKYGGEKEYNRQIINGFKFGEHPEIVIVVDKLLTGFDAPRNTVLYLTRKLKDHTLLQAIARVNRLYDGKDWGYIIDYYGVLHSLDLALDLYSKLPDFDAADLEGTLTDVARIIAELPQRHSDLWDVFKEVRNKRDEEEYERLLADKEKREKFRERLSVYSRTLAVALSTVKFIEEKPEGKVQRYKDDMAFFNNLRGAVGKRYAEAVDFKDYEPKIQKLIDTYVGAGEAKPITDLVNIFDAEAFAKEIERVEGTGSKADTIAFRTKRTIEEHWNEDPAFYKRFSKMLEEAIENFRARRLADADYLRRVMDIMNKVRNRTDEDIPEPLKQHDVAKAFYGIVAEVLDGVADDGFDRKEAGVQASLVIDRIIREKKIVNWENNPDVQKRMETAIEDALFALCEEHGIELSFDDIDKIMGQCIEVGKVRYAS